MSLFKQNLLRPPAYSIHEELFETLLQRPGIRVERIVSTGQSTPEGEWYDQSWDEWVLLLSGSALLLFDGEQTPTPLEPGDALLIPAHRRHRVSATASEMPTVWLALHFVE